ncbi:glycosyltransferase [bacterium]|nr:glycosyltransferase [bacterium]
MTSFVAAREANILNCQLHLERIRIMCNVSGIADTQPDVSVIIPLYNKEKYIVATLRSVLQQTQVDFEVIVVDDGSTDRSFEKIQPYLDHIVFIHQENQGPSSARNRGILEARGEWIAFMDGDDLWRQGKLKTQVQFLRENPDFHWCGVNFTCESEGTFSPRLGDTNEEGTWEVLSDWMDEQGWPKTWTSALMMRRTSVLSVQMFDTDLPTGQDFDLCVRFALKFKKYAFYKQRLAHYVNNAENAISTQEERKLNSCFLMYQKHFHYINSNNIKKLSYVRRIELALQGLVIRSNIHYYPKLGRLQSRFLVRQCPTVLNLLLFLVSHIPRTVSMNIIGIQMLRMIRQTLRDFMALRASVRSPAQSLPRVAKSNPLYLSRVK